MEEERKKQNPEKQENIRNEKGRFKKGCSGNLLGRPPGKSLKGYWRERFADMTDEEKEEFSKKVSPELLWQMAEGRPKQDVEGDISGNITIEGFNFITNEANNKTNDKTGTGVEETNGQDN
jgi:hypothetical protein